MPTALLHRTATWCRGLEGRGGGKLRLPFSLAYVDKGPGSQAPGLSVRQSHPVMVVMVQGDKKDQTGLDQTWTLFPGGGGRGLSIRLICCHTILFARTNTHTDTPAGASTPSRCMPANMECLVWSGLVCSFQMLGGLPTLAGRQAGRHWKAKSFSTGPALWPRNRQWPTHHHLFPCSFPTARSRLH